MGVVSILLVATSMIVALIHIEVEAKPAEIVSAQKAIAQSYLDINTGDGDKSKEESSSWSSTSAIAWWSTSTASWSDSKSSSKHDSSSSWPNTSSVSEVTEATSSNESWSATSESGYSSSCGQKSSEESEEE